MSPVARTARVSPERKKSRKGAIYNVIDHKSTVPAATAKLIGLNCCCSSYMAAESIYDYHACYRYPTTYVLGGRYMAVLAQYNMDPADSTTTFTPNMMGNAISVMENNGWVTALLVLQAVLGSTTTTKVIQVTLLHHVSCFDPFFDQSSTQWDRCLFASYREVIHSQIGLVYFLVDLLKQFITVQVVQLDTISAAM